MNIVITGGGTGGHLFPGIAIAQEFQRRDAGARIVFLGTAAGLESRVLPGLGIPLVTVPVSGFKGKGPAKKLQAIMRVSQSFFLAASCLRRHKAHIVIGMGGYVSFPGIAAAKALGIPAVIHEQNSVPGLSNRMLGKIADRIFISYEASRRFFSAAAVRYSGMPVRLPHKPLQSRTCAGRTCVFICGGSQGAHAVNLAVMAALEELAPLRDRLTFIHQTGAKDAEMVAQGYRSRGYDAAVYPFIEDMYGAYEQADLVVSRSGASTLAELALCGKPSILLPLAHATHNHQEHNARAFVENKAAEMLLARELDGSRLARAIQELAADPDRLSAMADQARQLAKPDAAASVVEECRGLAAAARR